MRQRKDGPRSNGDAGDNAQALQSGAAEKRLLQHNDFQGKYPFRRRLNCRAA
jgi:hypothetical protein